MDRCIIACELRYSRAAFPINFPSGCTTLAGSAIVFVCERQCTCPSSTDGMTVDVCDAPDLHSSQEEADSRMLLHCMYIAGCAKPHVTSIVVRSPVRY